MNQGLADANESTCCQTDCSTNRTTSGNSDCSSGSTINQKVLENHIHRFPDLIACRYAIVRLQIEELSVLVKQSQSDSVVDEGITIDIDEIIVLIRLLKEFSSDSSKKILKRKDANPP